jgi:hypothetical protein
MRLPTQAQLDEAALHFADDWGEVDRVLYDLCAAHPDHDQRRFVAAKVAIVGRAYSAGLERCITPGEGEQAVMVGVEYMWRHGAEIDAILATVKQVEEPLDANRMRELVEQHGRLTTLLAAMPQAARRPRSFAAKYLHFHHPVVPIYDSYAEIALGKSVPWKASLAPFSAPPHADEWYYPFCARLFRLYSACLAGGLKVTTKTLDTYLWTIPT